VPKFLADDQFIHAWNEAKCSPAKVAELTGLSQRQVYSRRSALTKRGVMLQTVPSTPTANNGSKNFAWGSNQTHFVRRRQYKIKDGVVIVFSDPHWLPDHSTLGQNALEEVIKAVKPLIIICGGDALDGDTISKWDITRGHHKRFTVREELDCCVEHFTAIEKIAGKAELAWVLGNHDLRLSRYVAVQAEHLLDMPFTRLEDWFPKWPLSWTVEINPGTAGMTVIRHRNQAGMLHLQALKAGCHYAHGHLHKLNVHRFPTFNGVRYSVDCGSLADGQSDGFDYAEGAPEPVQGFAVLTYRDGMLLPPELCEVVGDMAYFRGQPV
jgi:hypothetical protein